MKNLKKIASLLLALALVLSLAVTAFAQEESAGSGPASITIENAVMGKEYKVFKLFEAKVSETGITYQGEIPEALTSVFKKNAANNIEVVEGKTDADVVSAVQSWAETASGAVASTTSDGTVLKFTGLEYGYYAITTTTGTTVTVDSAKENVIVKDKNDIVIDVTKTIDESDVNIGDTVTYTVSFTGYNYDGVGNTYKKITNYKIEDTLPEYLTDVTVTGIMIGGTEYKVDGKVPQFDNNKAINIPWVNDNGEHLYKNGTEVVITYTAVVGDEAVIDGAGNPNKVTLTWDGGSDEDEAEFFTYAIAVKKVDQSGNNLPGAKFQFPFYVNATADSDGAYIYAGTTAGEGLVNEITTPESGLIIVKGVKSGTYTITETEAPAGYNALGGSVTVTAAKTGATSTKIMKYLDENGNVVEIETTTKVEIALSDIAAGAVVVVNKTGTVLPSTGGMGTTLFYVAGGILVAAAVVLLVTKKRMSAE